MTTTTAERLDRLVADLVVTPPVLTDHRSTWRRVSAVLTTYNRCPFDPSAGRLHDNPLTWALDTLRGQAGDTLAEIVVVDDGSTDHTGDVLDHYTALPGEVPVRAVRLAANAGMTAGRNIAVEAASCDWLLFGDDDCLFSAHYAAGAAYTLARLRDSDRAAGLVMLPFYYRALRPRDVVDLDEIGRLDLGTAHFSTRFHAFPSAYLDGPAPLLDAASGLLAPLPVHLVGGTFLTDRALLTRAGGFSDQTGWRSAYAEALYLSADLTRAGVGMYFVPDPRLSAPHLKFGTAGRFPIYPADLDTVVPILDRPFA
ncbi:glycosyltransferase family 2 protein, partial [Frankia sp. Cr1]|uniref:glycosyltransferase family 2 protein n=1 Tax=Frankia sp. Cr1 TaxID=3073931 RepID=UPI002AD45AA9